MKDEKKKVKPIIALVILCVMTFCISGTLAYFISSANFENRFNTSPYSVTYEEKFESPDNWTPGTETDKEVFVTNKSANNIVVRIFLDDAWSEGVSGVLENGEKAALVNLQNLVTANSPNEDWIKVTENGKDYYYYTIPLKPGEKTTSVLDSVTFNPNAPSGTVCIDEPIYAKDKVGEEYAAKDPNTIVGTKKICSSNGNGYDDATYQLNINIETVQADVYREHWNTTVRIPNNVEPDILYNIVMKDSLIGDSVKYTGLGSDDYQKDVYIYQKPQYTNVLFANFCWKMIRTTENGGVKLLYNGLPTNGTCDNNGTATQFYDTGIWDSKSNSISYMGYMYNKSYAISSKGLTSSNVSMNSSIVISKDINDLGNGTYSLSNPITVTTTDWAANYKDFVGHYMCSTPTASTCTSLRYIVSTTNSKYKYNYVYLYSNSFKYEPNDNGEYVYKLVDPILISSWDTDFNQFNNYHYTCFNLTGDCGKSINYMYHIRVNTPFYLNLKDGKNIKDAMTEMLWADDVNNTDSLLKTTIDNWYANNLVNYTKYLEDAVYCNDRSISDYNGWDPNGSGINDTLQFYAKNIRDLTCSNKNDQFTVNISNGNGKLTYPIGLLTAGEASLAGSEMVFNGNYYWLMSPGVYSHSISYQYAMSNYDEPDHIPTNYTSLGIGIRPAITLNSQVKFASGNGDVLTPYVVDYNSVA